MTTELLWKGPNIHISPVLYVMSMKFMNVFNSPYFFVNITIVPVHNYYFVFCFKLYYPIVDIIVNHLYVFFLRSRKTSTKCFNKNKNTPQPYHLDVASKICSWKCCCIKSDLCLRKYIGFIRFLYETYLNRYRRKN